MKLNGSEAEKLRESCSREIGGYTLVRDKAQDNLSGIQQPLNDAIKGKERNDATTKKINLGSTTSLLLNLAGDDLLDQFKKQAQEKTKNF